MKTYPKTIMTTMFIVLINIVCVAQGIPSSDVPPPTPPPPGLAPIDGGLLVGFIIGSVIGIRSFLKGSKRN